ncbi:uncharacterized protein LOC120112805 [Phoenix dactylifera]|uniref:Uncharacterized protein LOC120112805 n=1 Tax=Phoenix dactylifera TaxID=42345 RepID=A0A8B9APC4_PHODC|nr:uncharacterized protein LOC120112805 [Phoenix dactylifera]
MGCGPDEVGSTMSGEEVEMAEEWFFPRWGFHLEPVGSEDRITRPPPGRIRVYLETLWAGLRFPLHGFVNELLAAYQVVLTQLAPNAWRMIVGFLSLCLAHGVPTSVNVFRWYFLLKSNPGDGEWLYLALRGGRPLFQGAPTSIHGWKEKFFFLFSERTWGFDPRWEQARIKSTNKLPNLSKGEQKILDALSGLGENILLNDLVSEDALVNVGLSSVRPQDVPKMVMKNAALYARFRKRAAEIGGAPPEPRKKARTVSSAGVEASIAQGGPSRSEVRAAEAHLAEAHSALAVREQEVKVAQLKVKELEARVERAQEEARHAAQHGVRLFRESEEFRDLLEEETVDGLIRGFEDFRNQLRRLCPEFDLNLLQLGAGVKEGDGSEDPAGAEVQATEEDEVPTEGDLEGASDAALRAAGETQAETSAAGGLERAPIEYAEMIAADDLGVAPAS